MEGRRGEEVEDEEGARAKEVSRRRWGWRGELGGDTGIEGDVQSQVVTVKDMEVDNNALFGIIMDSCCNGDDLQKQ